MKKQNRPNFTAMIYSVFNSKENNIVPLNAPPAFIACVNDDTSASSTNCVNLYNAWKASNNSAELHIYAKGGHGLRRSSSATAWIQRFEEWLDIQGYLTSNP